MNKKLIQFILDEQKKQHITDYRLAKKLDVAQSTVGRWLKGQSLMTIKDFFRICQVLKVTKVVLDHDGGKTTFKI